MDDQEKIPYDIEITFYPDWVDGEEVQEVIIYKDIIGYQVGNDVIAVVTKDGETLIYPLKNVKFVRHSPAQVEAA
jgi:hypothetical protein